MRDHLDVWVACLPENVSRRRVNARNGAVDVKHNQALCSFAKRNAQRFLVNGAQQSSALGRTALPDKYLMIEIRQGQRLLVDRDSCIQHHTQIPSHR